MKTEHPHAKRIIDAQWADGSWGKFHSLSAQSDYTTEMAMRRLYYLGFTKEDEPIKKAIAYMEGYLCDQYPLRDYVEKKHDWGLLTKLFVCTWLLRFDPTHPTAKAFALKWSKIIEDTFESGAYNHAVYLESYQIQLNPEKNKSIWNIENFYVVSIVAAFLPFKTQCAYLKHLRSHPTGIYYIYDQCLDRMPTVEAGKPFTRYLMAMSILKSYAAFTDVFGDIKDALKTILDPLKTSEVPLTLKDNILFPVSPSWRNKQNRYLDLEDFINAIIAD